MNRNILTLLIILIALGLVGWLAYAWSNAQERGPITAPETAQTAGTSTPTTPTQPSAPGLPDLITVTAPAPNQKVTSPVTLAGSARGNWYFEASFPIEIRDASGKVIGQGPAQAQGDWMTTAFVPFKATITFTPQPTGSKGTIVFHNDNPSGDPARDKQVVLPVTF